MHLAEQQLLIGGALGVVAILAGLAGARIGTPLLLVFLALGMAAGEDGPGGIVFNDYSLTYLLGSLALVVILFEGGLKTTMAMVREGAAPAALLGTVGVAITAGLLGAAIVVSTGIGWPAAILLGALVAPTDAAAVASVLRASGIAVPHRVLSVLELESGLNDPVSVFLTVLLTELIANPAHASVDGALWTLMREMGGGAAFGLAGGGVMVLALRVLRVEGSLHGVLLLTCAVALFGASQILECSGFLAVYLAGVMVGNYGGERTEPVESGFAGYSWIAQIGLFLMLGLLITPHDAMPFLRPALFVAVVLIFVARPLAAAICLLPFRFGWRETGFIGWVGLRGAVPIYLAMIPVLAGLPRGEDAFELVFVIVIVSLIVQGWSVGLVARLLRLPA